ncbi:hypothetical protein JZ751_008093 [Albula glossodonta]|uniref:Tubulin polyglutamylase ttll6 n=1 Tax=Albula glossodonta TaxID=121402 RepID=A0A8T2P9S2_9TELE|nr:hypothetical protein JZ751_008093 [Albula glossodonta]
MGPPVESNVSDLEEEPLKYRHEVIDEGEGWGSESCTPTRFPHTGGKRKKKKKKRYGLREAAEGEEWTLYWTDCSVSLDRVMDMKRYQKINHFPGMSEICRKDLLARNMNRMLKLFPKEYNIFPRTWCLPADYSDFQAYARAKKHKTYICKPDSGCQGRGIFITRSNRDIRPGEHMICQVYVSKPFIIDGYKFDLRIYVLVTSCDPFRIFLYDEGLARFCTTQYSEPSNSNMVRGEWVGRRTWGPLPLRFQCQTDGPVRVLRYDVPWGRAAASLSSMNVNGETLPLLLKLSTFKKHLEAMHYDTSKLWGDIEDVIIKTLISAHPILKHNYHTCFPNHAAGSACFEILGFDVLLDHRLKPWLLEVNHSPSFTTDSRLDREVKDRLLYDTLVLINLGACDRRKITEEEKRRVKERLQQNRSREARSEELRQSQAASVEQMLRYEAKHLGGFRRIFPCEGGEKQQLQELRVKQEQKDFKHKGRRDLQGESAGERVKPRKPPVRPPCSSLRNCSLLTIHPLSTSGRDATMVTDEEEEERLNSLRQRASLLRDLGVVDQVHQMLQGSVPPPDDGPPPHSQSDPQQNKGQANVANDRNCEGTRTGYKMESPVDVSRRPRHHCPGIKQQHPHGDKPSPQPVQQRWPWLGLDRTLQEPAQVESMDELHPVSSSASVEVDCHTPMELKRSCSVQRIPRTISASSRTLSRQATMSSSFTETRERAQISSSIQGPLRQSAGARKTTNRHSLQGLFIISTPAPLIQRPDPPQPPHRNQHKIVTTQTRTLQGMPVRLSLNSHQLVTEGSALSPPKKSLYYEYEMKKRTTPLVNLRNPTPHSSLERTLFRAYSGSMLSGGQQIELVKDKDEKRGSRGKMVKGGGALNEGQNQGGGKW